MSLCVRRSFVCLLSLVMFGWSPVQAWAVTYFWDVTVGVNGFGSGAGTWDGVNTLWNTDSTGAAAGITTAVPGSGDDLILNGGSAPAITLSGTQAASSFTISDNAAATLSGGTSFTIGGTGANSGIFVTSAVTSRAIAISAPVILNSASSAITISNAGGGSTSLTFGSLTGSASSGTQTINVTGSSTNTTATIVFGGVIGDGAGGGSVAMNFSYPFTTVLSAPNTYTGPTAVNAGALKLDFSAAGAPTSNILHWVAPGAGATPALVLGGGTVNVNSGTTGGAYSQQFNNVILTDQTSSAIFDTLNAGATSVSTALGTITRGANATLNFGGGAAAGAPNTTNKTITVSGISNDASGIIGPWAFINSGTGGGALSYATVNGSGQIVPAAGLTALASGVNGPNTNYSWNAVNLNLTADTSVNTITSASTSSGTLDLGSSKLTINGILVESNSGAPKFTASAGGSIVIGASKELVIVSNDNATTTLGYTFSAPIVDNPSGASALTIVGLNGTSRGVYLNAASTYTGPTTIGGNTGTLRLGSSGSIANSSSINIGAGAFFNTVDITSPYVLGGVVDQTLAGGGTWTANAAGVIVGTASGATGTISPGGLGTAGTLAITQPVTFLTHSASIFDVSAAANDLVNVTGNLVLNGTLAFNTAAAGTYTLYHSTGASAIDFSGLSITNPVGYNVTESVSGAAGNYNFTVTLTASGGGSGSGNTSTLTVPATATLRILAGSTATTSIHLAADADTHYTALTGSHVATFGNSGTSIVAVASSAVPASGGATLTLGVSANGVTGPFTDSSIAVTNADSSTDTSPHAVTLSGAVVANRTFNLTGLPTSVLVGATGVTATLNTTGDDDHATRVTLQNSGSAATGGVSASYGGGGNLLFNAAATTASLNLSFSTSGTKTALDLGPILTNSDTAAGAAVQGSVSLGSLTVYDPASLSGNFSLVTPVTAGNNLTLSNASGAFRAGAEVVSITYQSSGNETSANGFSIGGGALVNSAAIAQSSSVASGPVAFGGTNTIAGTLYDVVNVGVQNDHTIGGATAGDLGTKQYLVSATVTQTNPQSFDAATSAFLVPGQAHNDLNSYSTANTVGHTARMLYVNYNAAVKFDNTSNSNGTLNFTWFDPQNPTANGGPAMSAGGIAYASHLGSDILDVSGIDGQLFVLQMSYDPTKFAPTVADSAIELVSYDAAQGKWVPAVSANHSGGIYPTNTPTFYDESYNAFLAANGDPTGTALDAFLAGNLGAYGVDTSTDQAWAIVNHNTEFAVVPEPSSLVLLAFGALAGFGLWRKKKPVMGS